MFFKNRQAQMVNVNELIEQTRESEQDRYKVERIEKLVYDKWGWMNEDRAN